MFDLKKIYNGKKVLVTGHTGFKGSWLIVWLNLLGANVVGISKGLVPSDECGEVFHDRAGCAVSFLGLSDQDHYQFSSLNPLTDVLCVVPAYSTC